MFTLGNPFNDASVSYFHKSVGGYHAAKLMRYQELIENAIYREMSAIQSSFGSRDIDVIENSMINTPVLNMLNTKYFITQNGRAQLNPGALGNAWFVNNIEVVNNADQEIAALTNFNPSEKLIVDQRFSKNLIDLNNSFSGTINLDSYKPNYLKYTSNSNNDGLAVFSEIYYSDGWNAYIDGEKSEYFRANYVLRAMKIPAGNHIIEFKFEPSAYLNGEKISLASSVSLLLLLFLAFYKEFKS